LNTSVKLCPACNKENEDTVSVCRHCGARLGEFSTKFVGISDSSINASDVPIESFIDLEWIPEIGIGIQVAGEPQPIYVPLRKELVIGRTTEYTPLADDFLDLAHLKADTMGVSRKHAMIKRIEAGYEVVDLASRNGSWLNDERLVPKRPYPLANGSILRIGNMRLLIIYHSTKKSQ